MAVGPEGGWVEPDELEFLQSFGFQVKLSAAAICGAFPQSGHPFVVRLPGSPKDEKFLLTYGCRNKHKSVHINGPR